MIDFEKGRPNHTTEEINEVAERAKAGDSKAQEELGIMMQPIVISYLRRIKGDYTRDQRNEMTQEAWFGIWEALKKWKRDKRKFSGYAYFFMKGAVQKWLAANSGVLPIPRSAWAHARIIEDKVADITNGTIMPYELPDDTLAKVAVTDKKRTVESAGNIFRARQPGRILDPNFEPREGSAAAEDEYIEVTDDEDTDALITFATVQAILLEGDLDGAWTEALAFAERHDLPEDVAENMMEEAEL